MGFLDNVKMFLIIFVVLLVCIIPLFIYGLKREKEEASKASERVLKTRILDKIYETQSTTHTSTGSALGRAAVGGAIAGPLGAAIGASTAKQNIESTDKWVKTIFLVIYKDGTHEMKTVANDNAWFKMYMEKLEIE